MFPRTIKQGDNTTIRTSTPMPPDMIRLRAKHHKVVDVIYKCVAVFVMYNVGFSERVEGSNGVSGYSLPLPAGDIIRVM